MGFHEWQLGDRRRLPVSEKSIFRERIEELEQLLEEARELIPSHNVQVEGPTKSATPQTEKGN